MRSRWNRRRRLGAALIGCLCVGSGALGGPASASGSPTRVYEVVSAADKGVDIERKDRVRSSLDGTSVVYMSRGSGSGALSRGLINQLRSARGEGSWTTDEINPPLDPLPFIAVPQVFDAVSPNAQFTASNSWGLETFGHPQVRNLWLYRASDKSFQLVSQPELDLVPETGPFDLTQGSRFTGGSDHFDHIVFHSSKALLPGLPAADPDTDGTAPYLYEWSATDGLRALGHLPADEGGGLGLDSVLGYGNPVTFTFDYPGDRAVSADGSRIFFSSGNRADLAQGV